MMTHVLSESEAYLHHPQVNQLIELALEEDAVNQDITTLAIQNDSSSKRKIRATIVAKQPTIATGFPLVPIILERAGLKDRIQASSLASEGSPLAAKSPWILLEGHALSMLRIERVILNFLIRMCGIAMYARQVCEQIAHTSCQLLHTRKTAPGHRRTDVYATLTGGAKPHRLNLQEAILLKENHWRAATTIQDWIEGIQKNRQQAKFVEIEVTSFEELKYALLAKPDRIMLDNFSLPDIAKAVNAFGSSVQFEASGNITVHNAKAYADTGVDFISLGSITHSAPAADLSMLFDFQP